MRPLITIPPEHPPPERAAPSAPVGASTRRCVVCGRPLMGRPQQRCCSARCRAALSRWRTVRLPVGEVREIRAALVMVLESAYTAQAVLDRYLRR
jgi:predicted nucleic acid-binding Zn ribbon protein